MIQDREPGSAAKIMALEWLSLDGTRPGGARDRNCLLTADTELERPGSDI
jgi:hypothetical protein